MRNIFHENIQVIGEGYIGRTSTIGYVNNILNKNTKDGGVVISGLTRMGKTSLVKKCFYEARQNNWLQKNNIICGEITISSTNNFYQFLRALKDVIYDELEERDLIDDKLERLASKMKEACECPVDERIYEMDRVIGKILKHLVKVGLKTVILLDEFDDAQKAFRYESEELSTNFQRFRNYASDSEYNVTFILTSRVSISRVDASLPAGSNLRGVFSEKVLVGFSDEEQNLFFDKITECGRELSGEQKKQVIWYAGRSPFLFAKIACGILDIEDNVNTCDISIFDVVEKCKGDFIDYFDSLVNFMINEKMYSKIIQLFFGPKYDLCDRDIETLKDFGYIYHDIDDKKFIDFGCFDTDDEAVFTYQTICEYFIEYMRMRINMDNSNVIWEDLINAEKQLRRLVERGLREEFGNENWRDSLMKIAVNGEKGFLFDANKAAKFIENSKKNFGDSVDDNPLSVISIDALSNIIKSFWDDRYSKWFKPPYNELKELCSELELLSRARNPLAHGTPEYLSTVDKECVVKYSKKISNIDKSGKRK